jgi:hypothetical protein
LWAYQTSVKTTNDFSPFQLIYALEVVFPIECHIPSLKLEVKLLPETSLLEECLLYIEQLDEKRHDAPLANKGHKKKINCQYNWFAHPRIFSEGDLVLVNEEDKDPLGASKFKPMWFIPFIMKKVLNKGAYHLVDFKGKYLAKPRNGIYLKKYYL